MNSLVKQINKTFELKEKVLLQIHTEEELINVLSIYIQELINKDFDHLLWLLYKIDVNEKKVKQAIAESETDQAHITIAKMIIAREKSKIKTREKYKSDAKEDDWIF